MGKKNIKKFVHKTLLFITTGVCILALPYYYQYKAYLALNSGSDMEFTYLSSAVQISIIPSIKIEMLRSRAEWFFVNGQKENCIQDLQAIERSKQSISSDYSMLATCFRQKQDWDRALEYALKSEKPNEIAKVYLGMREFDKALEYSNEAVGDSSNKQYSKYLTRAKIEMQMGNFYNALMDLNTLVSHCPNQAWTYYERAKLKKALNDLDGANADLQMAAKLEGKLHTNNMLAEN